MFNSEFKDHRRKYSNGREISVNCKHGTVVELLKKTIESKLLSEYNNIHIGRYSELNGKIQYLFEVKTSASDYDIYTAIGQLTYWKTSSKSNDATQFLVIAEDVSDEQQDVISQTLGSKS